MPRERGNLGTGPASLRAGTGSSAGETCGVPARCRRRNAVPREASGRPALRTRRGGRSPVPPTAWLGALETSEPPRFAPGDRIAERYEIRDLLGRGGMGEVYNAWDSGLEIEVALKVLRIAIQSEESYRRLKMEGFLARSVWHPNICRLFDLGRHDGKRGTTWFLTMEKLQGFTLSERLRNERLPLETVRSFAEQMAAALGSAHAAGVVHRDFKPGNVILVNRDGAEEAVVTDFGIARSIVASDSGESSDSLVAAGTPAYMAPEQVRGEPGGPEADIYALGVVLFEMVTGMTPFRGVSPLDMARRRLTEEPPSPRDLVPDLDERWERTILRCLERDPDRRFRRAEDVAAGLDGRAPHGGAHLIAPAAGPRDTVPAERDDFVGRKEEIDRLEHLFDDGIRLVTLAGAAGMGEDAARGPVRTAEPRDLAGRRLVLRSQGRARPQRRRRLGRALVRPSARSPGPGGTTRTGDRRPGAMPPDPRQLRASRGARTGVRRKMARGCARGALSHHEPGAIAPRPNGARACRRAARGARGHGPLHVTSAMAPAGSRPPGSRG